MSNEVLDDDIVRDFEDDVIELTTIEDDNFPCVEKEKKDHKRRRTSTVREHFDAIRGKKCEKLKAKCKLCGTIYLAPSIYETVNLKRHIDSCSMRNTRDIEQMLLYRSQGSLFVSNSKFCLKKFRELLVASVIKHDLPFRYVEYEGIREMIKYLHPDAPLIYRNILKADLKNLHMREKKKVKFMLNGCPKMICLTSNMWTSLTTDEYMCLTSHFIDKNWILTKIVLNFLFMPPPHDDISLCEKTYNMLEEWGIETKGFTITLDNASSNDVCVGLLRNQLNMKKALLCEGEFFHIRYCAHILNLIVQDGLKNIDSAFQKIRDSVKYVRGSQMRKQNFLQAVNKM
jgi:hypothetical protein